MNNTKLTNIILIILLIFNVVFVGRWWMTHHKFHHSKKEAEMDNAPLSHDRNKREMFLVKTLNLDSVQQKKLDTILTSHYAFLNKYMTAYVRNQVEFFNTLKNNPDTVTAFRCADSMAILKIKMEREFYLHLLGLKNICNSQQQTQYNQLIDNVSQDFVIHHNFSNSAKTGTSHDTL
jgi:hypothetical protein